MECGGVLWCQLIRRRDDAPPTFIRSLSMTSRLSLALALAGAVATAPSVLAAQPPAAPTDTARPPLAGRRGPPSRDARGIRDTRGDRRQALGGSRGAVPQGFGRRMERGMAGPGRTGGPGRAGGPGAGGPGAGGDPASHFLAHTGDLKLTDQQVTRLAAIARRAGDRRTALRARVDSMRAANRPQAPNGAPDGMPGATPRATRLPRPAVPPMLNAAEVQRLRDQSHAELRDAIAVLTADQQATAWEMLRGGPGRGAAGRRR